MNYWLKLKINLFLNAKGQTIALSTIHETDKVSERGGERKRCEQKAICLFSSLFTFDSLYFELFLH